jgi:hypothetical protein
MNIAYDDTAPETMTITRAEWDQVKLDTARTLELHKLIRIAAPLIAGDITDPAEIAAIRETWDHYVHLNMRVGG